MFEITKNREPRSLVQYRVQADSTYNGADSVIKKDIREGLLSEQGFLCAYCMGRISIDNMKIEHWACQSNPNTSALQLTYSNLLGCCMGNEKNPPKSQTCDTKKGNSSIKYSPSNPIDGIGSKIDFLPNGVVFSDDCQFDQEINDVLNLNFARLVSNRLAVIKAIQTVLFKSKGNLTKQRLTNLINNVSSRDGGNKLQPFFEVKVRYLRKKSARL